MIPPQRPWTAEEEFNFLAGKWEGCRQGYLRCAGRTYRSHFVGAKSDQSVVLAMCLASAVQRLRRMGGANFAEAGMFFEGEAVLQFYLHFG